MKQTIQNASQFRDEFRQCGRADQFSYEALGLLFDYFEEIDPDYDLDVIAICCEYSEDSAAQIADWYGINWDENYEAGSTEAVLSYLNDNTSVVGVTPSGSIVYAQF
tara:strand:+ start:1424 stop:1744 length:321 start_codon:yes stop_codon:yes gene_type:complete